MRSVDALSDDQLASIRALIDTIIPADEWPAGWAGGVRRLLEEHGDDFMSWAWRPLLVAADALDKAADDEFGVRSARLDESSRRRLLDELLESTAPEDIRAAVTSAILVADQGYYAGTSEPAGWAMVSYSDLPQGVVPVEPELVVGLPLSELADDYDIVVIGAGAGGGVAAAELAERGLHVLLVERSHPMTQASLRSNHLQDKRTALYDVTAGPHGGSPRILVGDDGNEQTLDGAGNALDWGLVAMTLGGGTRLWQGMSWRFWEQDFAMASLYGSPEGSTLANWPFAAEELTPYYDRIERELGVSGAADSAVGRATARNGEYPMPPLRGGRAALPFADAASRLGLSVSPIPFAINSVGHDGRAACVHCGQCVGAGCPVGAKNGTHNTFIPRAMSSGNSDLLMSTQALAIEFDGSRTATGVSLVTETAAGPVRHSVRARTVVVAAGAIETPRLLLASGVDNDWIGRNHHSHGIAIATAASGPDLKTFAGPGHTIASVDFVHRAGEGWGGGVMFDGGPALPYDKARLGRTRRNAHLGLEHKRWMRETPNALSVMSMVQEIPDATSVIRLDPRRVDRHGMPAVRLSGRAHPATIEAVDYMLGHCTEWLEAVGGRDINRTAIYSAPQGAEHSAGTARFASSADLGSCDPTGRVFGTANVYVADASLHPTNGGFNPGLTVMANALRVADVLATRLR